MESAFQRKCGSGFLTRGAETQLSSVVILLKGARFALMRWSHQGSHFSDSLFHVVWACRVANRLLGKRMLGVSNCYSVTLPHVKTD